MEDLKLMTNFNKNTTSQRKKLTYPYIYLPMYGEEVGVVLSCVEKGQIPIVLKDGDVLKQVWTITSSALELNKLLSVYPFQILRAPNEVINVNNVEDIMGVVAWMAY